MSDQLVGICGALSPGILGSDPQICDLPALHAGWHGADNVTPIGWPKTRTSWVNETDWPAEVAALRQQLDEANRVLELASEERDNLWRRFNSSQDSNKTLAAMAREELDLRKAAEADRDRLEADLAAALNVDDWEHPADLIAMVRALRLGDEEAARLLVVYRAAGELVTYLDCVGDLRCSAGERIEGHLAAIAAAYRAGAPAEPTPDADALEANRRHAEATRPTDGRAYSWSGSEWELIPEGDPDINPGDLGGVPVDTEETPA